MSIAGFKGIIEESSFLSPALLSTRVVHNIRLFGALIDGAILADITHDDEGYKALNTDEILWSIPRESIRLITFNPNDSTKSHLLEIIFHNGIDEHRILLSSSSKWGMKQVHDALIETLQQP